MRSADTPWPVVLCVSPSVCLSWVVAVCVTSYLDQESREPFPTDLSLDSLTALLRGEARLHVHGYEVCGLPTRGDGCALCESHAAVCVGMWGCRSKTSR